MFTPVISPAEAGSTAMHAQTSKLSTAAKQFETVLLSQWLQEAESSFASVPGGDSDTDAGSDQLKGMATQQLATSFASSGGLGISKLVLAALKKTDEKEEGGSSSKVLSAVSASVTTTHALAAYRTEALR